MPYNQYPLSRQAHGLASLGRNGDSMLAHITPKEAGILKLMGGSGTVNPYTGLPEFWGGWFGGFVDDVLGIDDSGGILGSAAEILKPLGPVAPIAASLIPGYGPWLAAAITGLQTGEDGKAFNFKKAATAAALSFGAQQLANSAGITNQATFGEGAPAGTDVASIADAGIDAAAAADASTRLAAASVEPATTSILDTITNPSTYTDLASKAVDPTTYTDLASSAIDTVTNPQTYSDLASGAWDYAKQSVSSPLEALKTASTVTTAVSGIKTLQELERQKEEAERILADQAAAKAEDIAWAQSVMAQYPLNYRRLSAEDVRPVAGGGIIALAKGGQPQHYFGGGIIRKLLDMPEVAAQLKAVTTPPPPHATAGLKYDRPTVADIKRQLGLYGDEEENNMAGGRYLQGPGDGTSDSIPARIEGGQEARLADGEYVIDARTVSELGNGSSNAGARKLRDMVNRVHAQRRKAQRGKPSSADKYLPV